VYVPFNQVPIGETGREPALSEEPEDTDEEADELAGKVVQRIKEKLGAIGKTN
jgi:hypothetical protein